MVQSNRISWEISDLSLNCYVELGFRSTDENHCFEDKHVKNIVWEVGDWSNTKWALLYSIKISKTTHVE